MKNLLKNKAFIIATFFVIMGISAGITGYVTARNESARAQSQKSNSELITIDLFESSASLETITAKVGQTIQVNNKSSYSRELSLGSGNAAHESERGDEKNQERHDETMEGHDHQSGFSSGMFEPDEAWQATFQEPGTYFLHDHANPDLNILVVVYESSN